MWKMRSLWTPQRSQNVWWVGAARSYWWILIEKYSWRFIHQRGNGIRKGYLWRRVQVFSLWGKEEVWNHSFSIPGSDWGAIGEKCLSDRGAGDQSIEQLLEIYAVYRVALIQPRSSSLVATHCTADVRLTSNRPVTLGLLPIEISTSISGSYVATYVVNAYVSSILV